MKDAGTIRERLRDFLRWESMRMLLLVSLVITIIISLFQLSLDPLVWLREIITNFITTVSIAFITMILTTACGIVRLGRDWKRLVLLLFLLAGGGMLGGLISWGINCLLFPYRITHPHIYLMMVAVLSIIFGMSVIAYYNVRISLDETAARLAEKEVQEQRLLRHKTRAELEALRAKVNPHFLFNTLNSIASLIPVDPEKAEEMVQKLANLFHYTLSASNHDLVPLEQELDFIESYLQIEQVRLGARLNYRITRGDSLERTMIPGMLLQPLVENSVQYGIAPMTAGGQIDITCAREGDTCVIAIVDNGTGYDAQSAEEGFGIGSVRSRLALHFPERQRFTITADAGVSIEIRIPAVPA